MIVSVSERFVKLMSIFTILKDRIVGKPLRFDSISNIQSENTEDIILRNKKIISFSDGTNIFSRTTDENRPTSVESLTNIKAANSDKEIIKVVGTQDSRFATPRSAVSKDKGLFHDSQSDDIIEQVFSKVRHNRIEAVIEELRLGFSVNDKDKNGNTILHICAQNNHRKLANHILNRYPNCEINAKNSKGYTALDYSEKYGFVKQSQWLILCGAARGSANRNSQGIR